MRSLRLSDRLSGVIVNKIILTSLPNVMAIRKSAPRLRWFGPPPEPSVRIRTPFWIIAHDAQSVIRAGTIDLHFTTLVTAFSELLYLLSVLGFQDVRNNCIAW